MIWPVSWRFLILSKLGLSLSTIAFLMAPCFRAHNFESIPLILRSVAYDLTCFIKFFDLSKLGLNCVYSSCLGVPPGMIISCLGVPCFSCLGVPPGMVISCLGVPPPMISCHEHVGVPPGMNPLAYMTRWAVVNNQRNLGHYSWLETTSILLFFFQSLINS